MPNLTLVASFLLYLAARHFDWNLAAFPTGSWYFNPYCWQFLFVFGGWFVLGGSIEARPLIRSRALLWLGSAYLLFALDHDDGGTISGDRSHATVMALRCVQSQRQNQPRTLPAWSISSFLPFSSTGLCRVTGGASNGRYSGRSSSAANNRSRSSVSVSLSRRGPRRARQNFRRDLDANRS